MIPNNVHDPDYWVNELMPLLKEIDFALQISVPRAHQFFTEYLKKPMNRPLLSNLIRYYALEYLRSRGFDDAQEEGADGWDFRGLPNNGIELLYRQGCIRIRKGIDPPYPTTTSSEDFYQQKLFDEIDSGIQTNLLVLFNLDATLQYDGKLRLMRPEKLNAKKKLVKCDWSRTIQIDAADVSTPVPSQYMHPPELPLGVNGSDSKELPKTGSK
jgi:hypothetical protein